MFTNLQKINNYITFFSHLSLMDIKSAVASFIPVMFIFQVIIPLFVLKFITPSDVVFNGGTSFFPSSFALYFHSVRMNYSARTKEPNATAIPIKHTVRAFSMLINNLKTLYKPAVCHLPLFHTR